MRNGRPAAAYLEERALRAIDAVGARARMGWSLEDATAVKELIADLASANAEVERQQEIWSVQSGVIRALADEVPDDVRARVLAPLLEAAG
jgi:hypothetical protein